MTRLLDSALTLLAGAVIVIGIPFAMAFDFISEITRWMRRAA